MRRHLPLSGQLLLLQISVLLLTLLVGAVAWFHVTRAQLQTDYGERALAIADAVAALPSVAEGVLARDTSTLQPLGEAVRQASGMSFVVITDAQGLRFSHPDPERLGERVSTDPGPALSGRRVVEVETGTLGHSVRGKSPIVADGEVVGIVSVGILMEHVVADFVVEQLPTALLFVAPALALGIAGSLLLARRFKRLTFGLEPREIASLLEHREAMLHGIREGFVGLDPDGRVAVVNDEARRLLQLHDDPVGERPEALLVPGPLRDLLTGRDRADDVAVFAGAQVLVASRMPVSVRGESVGTVVTLRDRTELVELSRELDGVRDVADALRAQAHEFDNHVHTVAGLIELGHHEEALTLLTATAVGHQQLSDRLAGRLHDPSLVALLLAKTAIAAERDVELVLTADSHLGCELADPKPLLTVTGNLIDNAIDACVEAAVADRRVEVTVRERGAELEVVVADHGPGVRAEDLERVFDRGYSTKAAGRDGRGIGLALVRQVVARLGGELAVRNAGGAVFTVSLPVAALTATGTAAATAAAAGVSGRGGSCTEGTSP
ncbi:ATP-binding protein [Egicoccus sp. AB-alg2]|uniref:ATP-binding protein n=1 Tax=Egicoccus sp. AB-alg2 TaxID=3242693 RepID=UPI00359CE4E1